MQGLIFAFSIFLDYNQIEKIFRKSLIEAFGKKPWVLKKDNKRVTERNEKKIEQLRENLNRGKWEIMSKY